MILNINNTITNKKMCKSSASWSPLGSLLAPLARLWAPLGLNWSSVWLPGAPPASSNGDFLANSTKWSQNNLKVIPKLIPKLFRSEMLGQSEPEIFRKSIQNRSNIHHTCMSGFDFSFLWFFITFSFTVQSIEPSKS